MGSKPENIVYSVWGIYEGGEVKFLRDPLIDGTHQVLVSFVNELGGDEKSDHLNTVRSLLATDKYKLSEREFDILLLVKEGRTNGYIAEILELGEGTVRNYISSILDKLDVSNRTEAVNKALNIGLISVSSTYD